MNTPKACKTCIHATTTEKCLQSGYYITTQRQYPTKTTCDGDFSHWQPKLGLFQRIKYYFTGKVD